VDKFRELILYCSEVICPNTLNYAYFSEFLLFPIFGGHPNFFYLTFKATSISHHVAHFQGDRSRELGNLRLKCKKSNCPLNCFGATPPVQSINQSIKTHLCSAECRERIRGAFRDLHCLNAHISNHVSKFHSDRPRALGDIAPQRARNKRKNISSKT